MKKDEERKPILFFQPEEISIRAPIFSLPSLPLPLQTLFFSLSFHPSL
jgi:hypothetical protein